MACTHNLTINKGVTFEVQLTATEDGTAIDLTNYTVSGKFKTDYGGDTVRTFTEGDGITVTDATNGVFTVTLTDAETAALTQSRLVHQFTIESAAGVVTCMIQGVVVLFEGVNV